MEQDGHNNRYVLLQQQKDTERGLRPVTLQDNRVTMEFASASAYNFLLSFEVLDLV